MAAPLTAAIPDRLVLGGSYVLRFTAINPTTGSLVSGVVVSDVAVEGDDLDVGAAVDVPLPEALLAYQAGSV